MSRDALVVGINIYQDDNLRNLNAPAEDAEAIAKILEQYGEFDVWRRPEAIDSDSKKPYVAKIKGFSLTDLEKALVKLFKPEGRQVPDTALFYFSGHGLRKDRGIQEGFLATTNVDTNQGFYGLSLKWLRELLEESPIRQQIIWLDCCHSGEILNFSKYDPGEQGQARDRCFIAASREFEFSFEDLNSEYSVLTKVLLSGLDPNRCPQQWITSDDLIVYIKNNLRNKNQRPVFSHFGSSPINLTRTLDTPIPVSKGQDSQDICPYKGLEYFDFNDEDPKYFYGRETLTDKLIDRVRQSNFLAILGASGSGKSSVLRAGLLHKLKLGQRLAGSEDWKIKIMLPGEHPLQSLALSWLESDLSVADRATELDKIKSLLQKGSEGLLTLVQAAKANRVILVIDQFEEAFTLCQDLSEREAFFKCLLEALEQTDNKLCLILAMRIDFFGKCVEREYSELGQKIQANLITIPPMKREELRQAIIKPAEKVNLSLESGLAETILKDIKGSPGSLPLLEDTLRELWYRRENNQLKFTAYVQLGGIGGTLDRRATEVYEGLSQPEQNAAKHIFLSLTTLGEGTEDTRRRVLKKDLVTAKHNAKLIDSVVQKLANAKLIVTRDRVEPNSDFGKQVEVKHDSEIDKQPEVKHDSEVDKQPEVKHNSEVGKQAEVDVAHEALIRNWILLRQWLNECRDQLRQKRKIEDAAQEWQISGQKTDYLLSKKRLREAKEFQEEQQEKYPLPEDAAQEWQISGQKTDYLLSKKRLREAKEFQKEQQEKYPLSELASSFVSKSIKYQRNERIKSWGLFLIVPLIGTYFVFREIQLNIDHKLILDCVEKRHCSGRIKSLERLVKAKRSLRSYNLRSAHLEWAYLYNADLEGANLSSANLKGANLYNAYLYNANLSSANLSSANLESANLSRANLSSANLDGASLDGADLSSANLSSANLGYANLKGVDLHRANLRKTRIDENTKLDHKWRKVWEIINQGAEGQDLKFANLEGANLEGANLSSANLESANLSRANLESANLRYAYLSSAYLSSANLRSAYLISAYLYRANLINVINLTSSQIKSTCYWEQAFYKGNYDQENYKWIVDEKANKQYIEQLKQDKASDPKEPVDCSRWKK